MIVNKNLRNVRNNSKRIMCKKMKRILMVCEAFGGGVFTYVSQLCNDLVCDYDIFLAYSIRPQTPLDFKEHLDSRIHLIETKDLCVKGYSLFGILNAVKELKKITKNVKPDIIHLHSSIAGGVGRLAFSGKSIPIVYTPHGYAHILMGSGIKSKIFKMSEAILGKSRNCITLTCCKSEDDEAKKFCKRTLYIETGVNINLLKKMTMALSPVKTNRFTVITIGRICEQKQPYIFNRIAQLVPEAHFVWIGDGEMKALLENVEVTGWIPREKVLALSKSADAFVLCSRGEAVSMSLLEIMYLKKLVLVSNVMGNNSVIRDGDNGYICETAEDYATRIKEAIREYPGRMVEKAHQEVVRLYNTDVMKEKYLKFYGKL